jgi:hypothetical protein
VGHPQQPSDERHVALLVLGDRRHELGEHLLGHVLGIVVIAHDRADVAVDVVGVTQVDEAHRVAIALLGTGDRAAHEPLDLGRRLDRRSGDEAILRSAGPRGVGLGIGSALLGSRLM